jgi:broad specificity phosphatase PhoE
LRHGKTNYTGVFPDLTNEGMQQVRRAAHVDVSFWMRKNRIAQNALAIGSSPSPRAHGTADVIASVVRHPRPIVIDAALDQMAWRDPVRCKEALGGLHGRGYIDYETEPIFSDSTLFETPCEMRTRHFSFFAEYIRKAILGKVPPCALLVSHYEVLCHLTRDVFGVTASLETALKHVEPIELAIFERDGKTVNVSGQFRDIGESKVFDLDSLSFF